ncbi:MAG TPA: RDD family protein, partial [Candidatus Dormibacteraeota bacterium]
PQVVEVEDEVAAPEPVPVERLRGYLALSARYTLGLVRAVGWRLRLGPLTLLQMGEPRLEADAVAWPIEGGLLAAEPGGELEAGCRAGRLRAVLRGYRPRLPRPLYDLTQLPYHHAVSRLVLLQLRGREPLPGAPAEPRARLLAGALDLALCAAVSRRRLRALPAVYAGYHLVAWSLSGQTLGGALCGLRVLAVDGSRVTPAQALVRLLAGDRAAGTAVVRA